MQERKESNNKLLVGLLIATLFMLLFNSYQLSGLTTSSESSSSAKESVSGVIPTGVPEMYGKELGVSFDDVSPNDPYLADAVIAKLSQLDRGIILKAEDKERYINILFRKENGMSCEYCCGAKSIIFENGDAACGCAHSFAMRGVTKYLITQHGAEYSDDEILAEVGKWKTLFFPTQMTQKAQVLESKDIEFNYINLASNKYRGIEQGKTSAGGMVGGC